MVSPGTGGQTRSDDPPRRRILRVFSVNSRACRRRSKALLRGWPRGQSKGDWDTRHLSPSGWGAGVARFPNRKIRHAWTAAPTGERSRRGCRASRPVRYRRYGNGSARMLKKMIRPVYESAVSARCIAAEQFGATVGKAELFEPAAQQRSKVEKSLLRANADSGQFDAWAAPLGLMVRSRDLTPAPIPQVRARRLEHRKSSLPDLRVFDADLG